MRLYFKNRSFLSITSLFFSDTRRNMTKSMSILSTAFTTRYIGKQSQPLFFFCVSLRMSIISIVAREILDSRGNPTVEVDLRTEKGGRCLARCTYHKKNKTRHNACHKKVFAMWAICIKALKRLLPGL